MDFDVAEISKRYEELNGSEEKYTTSPRVYDPGYYTPIMSMAERQQQARDNEWKATKAFYNGLVVEGGRGLLNATMMIRDMGLKQLKEENPNYEATEGTEEALKSALDSSAMQRYNVKGDSAAGQFGLDLISGAGQLVGQMGVAALTGGTGGALFMGAQIAGNQYEELRKDGVGVDRASQAAITNGIVQGLMEKIGLEGITKVLPANSPLKKKIMGYVAAFISEGGTEGLQELPEQLTNLWAKNPDASLRELGSKWDENANENLKAMAYSGVIGGILGVGGRAVNNTKNLALEQIGKKVHEHQVSKLEERIEDAKKKGLAPEEVAAITKESLPDESVSIDADMLQTFMQTKDAAEVAETLGINEEEVVAAVELGNDVVVSQGDYEAAAVKYNDFHEAMKEGISFGGADESVNNVQRREELRKEYQNLDTEVKTQLNDEVDKIIQSAEVAGVAQNAREGLRSILISRAMIWDPEHPANFFKEHALRFSNQGNANNGAQLYTQESVDNEEQTVENKQSSTQQQGAWGRKNNWRNLKSQKVEQGTTKGSTEFQQQQKKQVKGSIQFDEEGAAIINLFKGADASTVIHETGHYFVEAMARDIENGLANEQQIKDFEALLKYSDLDMARWKSIREQLSTGNLTEDEREALQDQVTKVHERLAEAFESYIIEGKAPKRELQHVFNRFAKWLRAVYSSVRQNEQGEEIKEYDVANRNKNAVALTKEVTDVFDRWLAAEEDIVAQETIEGYFAQIPQAARDYLSPRSQEQIKDFIARAHDEAVNMLVRTYMQNFGKERAAKIAAYKKKVKAEAEQAVRQRPLYTAMAALSEYLESGKQAPKTLARKYLRSLNNEALSRKEALENIKADINERLDPIVEKLEEGIGKERTYWIDKETGKEVDVSDLEKNKAEELKTKRFYEQVTEDTSADWYRAYKEKNGKRKPSKKLLREIAYEIYTGNDEYGLYAGDLFGLSAEDAEAYKAEAANNKAEIEALIEQQKYLENIAEVRAPFGWDKADTRFTMEEGDRILFDGIAQELGFHTGEELAKAIQNGDTFGQAVQKEINTMVDKVFPDYFTDAERRKDAIREALYNDKTGQVIALEQQLIEDYIAGVGVHQRSNEARAKLARARKQTIKNIALRKISGMTMRKLQNIRGFIRAERMAAAEAQRAIKNGDMEAAAMWKETQAVNHAIVVEAVRIKNEARANVRTIARIKKLKRANFGNEKHFNQVAALLARMGDRLARKDYDSTTKTQNLAEYVQEMSQLYDNVDIADWLLDETVDLSNAKDMTYEQYTDVINALKNLVAISRNERKQSKLDAERNHQEAVAEVVSKLGELKDTYKPGPNGKDDKSSPKYWMDRAIASLRNTDNLFELMDNWTYGYFSKTWGTALKRCADLEAELTMQMEEDFGKAYDEWIEANPEMDGNDRDVYYEELGTVANKHTLIKMLINLLNDGNSRVLCSTPPLDMKNSSLWVLADENISKDDAIAQTRSNLISFLSKNLNKADAKFAQAQVDIASRNWPLLADVERRTKGFTPKKVEASPLSLTFADGTTEVLKGGYYPLVRDSREGSKPANIDVFDIGGDIPAANVRTMHTNTGASKARTQAEYPISLAADSGMRSIRDVIHDIAYRETMADFRKLLNDKQVMPLLKRKLGIATTEQLGEMLIKTANPTGSRLAMAEDFYASAASWIRRKTVNAAIMLNIKTALQNLGNITLFGRVVEGFGYADTCRAMFGRALLQAADPRGNTELDILCSKSVFMRERVLFPDYTIKEIVGDEKLTPVQKKTMKWGSMVLAYTDNITAKPVWAEAYKKKIDEGASEQEAIDFADLIIRRVLGSNRTQDVSSFMRGGPIYKLFTSFQGFFNTQFNQWEREVNIARNFASEGEYRKAAFRITAFAMSKWLLNCMLAVILGIENPFEKDKDGYRNLTKEMMHYPLSMCGPIGQATNMFMDNALGISSYRFRLSAIESTLDKGGKLMRAVNRVAEGKDSVGALAEPTTSVVLPMVFDVPDQVNKLLWNAWDILYNDMSPRLEDIVRRRPKNERK